MPFVLVHEKVKDYASWKATFDGNSAMRANAGSKGGQVYQAADDPNEVVVLLEWDDLQRARDFAGSDELRQAMQRAGVEGTPHIHILELSDRPSA